jgi:hypothetical protein
MEPPEGFEPPTGCLQNSCSTTELRRRAFPLFGLSILGQIKIHFVLQACARKLSYVALILINGLMSLSLFCFYLGYYFRKRNNSFHRIANTFGIFFNLSAAAYLLAIKYAFGGVDGFGIYPTVDRLIIDVHRFFAACALILMLIMAYTGYTKKRNLHVKLHFVFLPLYTIVYISGLFLFKSHAN